jgi:hypothetical protein
MPDPPVVWFWFTTCEVLTGRSIPRISDRMEDRGTSFGGKS